MNTVSLGIQALRRFDSVFMCSEPACAVPVRGRNRAGWGDVRMPETCRHAHFKLLLFASLSFVRGARNLQEDSKPCQPRAGVDTSTVLVTNQSTARKQGHTSGGRAADLELALHPAPHTPSPGRSVSIRLMHRATATHQTPTLQAHALHGHFPGAHAKHVYLQHVQGEQHGVCVCVRERERAREQRYG
jgi:hypothetical protein